MSKNKGDAGNIAGSMNLKHKLLMNNSTLKTNQIQPNSRRELFESSKLSRLPQRKPFPPKASAVCVGCDVRLDLFDPVQMAFQACRKCIGIYSRLDAAFDEGEKRKRKEILERFAGGLNE